MTGATRREFLAGLAAYGIASVAAARTPPPTGGRTALVIIDMDYDLLFYGWPENGGQREGAANIGQLVDEANRQGWEKYCVGYNHDPAIETDQVILDRLLVGEPPRFFIKREWSALTNPLFSETLADRNVQRIIVSGASAGACVKATLLDLAQWYRPEQLLVAKDALLPIGFFATYAEEERTYARNATFFETKEELLRATRRG